MANAIYQNITGKTINGVAPGGQITSSDNNQALADQGFAWVGPAGSGSGASAESGSSSGGGSYDQYNFMTLKQAQRLAEKAFSGMQSPMTMEQIRQRELEAQELGRQTASAVYDPKIKGSEALGRGQISTTKGVVGQGSGFTLSTAEMTYLNNVQGEVQARTKEIVDAKANYIAQGDFAAAERADAQIASLREYENQLIMAKANYALQLMSGDREMANAILNQQKFAFEQQEALFGREMEMNKLEMTLANMMGEYRGRPTMAAEQNRMQNIMAEAGITGIYKGNETLDSRIKNAQLALQREGLELDWARFDESVRQFNQQMSLNWSKYKSSLPGDDENKTKMEQIMDQYSDVIIGAERSGASTDAFYWNIIDQISTASDVKDKEALDRYLINAIRVKKGEDPIMDWDAEAAKYQTTVPGKNEWSLPYTVGLMTRDIFTGIGDTFRPIFKDFRSGLKGN